MIFDVCVKLHESENALFSIIFKIMSHDIIFTIFFKLKKKQTINMICYFSCELVWDSVSTVFPLDKIHMKNNIS